MFVLQWFLSVELQFSGHWLKTAGTSSFSVSNTLTIPPSNGAMTNTLCALCIMELSLYKRRQVKDHFLKLKALSRIQEC